MNILIINHNAGSIKHGMELRPYYFAREWVKAGHKVTVVAASFSHFRQRNIECAKLTQENIEGIEYWWLPVPKYKGNDRERLINMLAFSAQMEFHRDELISLQPNLVIDSSSNPAAAYCCHDIARQSGAKYIAELHDPWELLPMELDNLDEYNSIMHNAEKFRCSHAYTIVTALPKLGAYLQSYGLDDKQYWCIPNGESFTEHDKYEKLEAKLLAKLKEYKADGKLLIGYAGTLDAEKALDVLLEAARKASADVQFIILGNGQEKNRLMQVADTYGLQNVTFLDAIPKTMVHSFLQEMDWLYAGWRMHDVYRYGISYSKITEYMFAGKPIIHSISAENDLVQEAQCGISIQAEDVEALLGAIEQAVHMPMEQRRKLGQRGRDYVAAQLDYRALAGWYLEVCRMKM